VNFERFCGHVAEGEGPESSGEREFAAKRREKTQKRSGVWRVTGGGGKRPRWLRPLIEILKIKVAKI